MVTLTKNIIAVSATKKQKEVLIDTQDMWSAVKIAENKVKEIKKLAIYKPKTDKEWGKKGGTIEGFYEVLGISAPIKIDNKKYENEGKRIIFLGKKIEDFEVEYNELPKGIQGRIYFDEVTLDSIKNDKN